MTKTSGMATEYRNHESSKNTAAMKCYLFVRLILAKTKEEERFIRNLLKNN